MVGRAQTPTSVDFRDFPAHLSSLKTYHIQILSTLVSYEELGAGFEPIRNGEIFWMKNNTEKSVAQIGHTLGFHQRTQKLQPPCTEQTVHVLQENTAQKTFEWSNSRNLSQN